MFKVINIESPELKRGGIIQVDPLKIFNTTGIELKVDTDLSYRKMSATILEKENSILPIENTYWLRNAKPIYSLQK